MEKFWGLSRLLQISGSNTTDEGNMSETGGNAQDTYEFVAFLLWYLFLVLCCIVPTCCAYRRRRLVERRLAQHHFDLQRLQQQQLNGHPNFLLLDQISSSNPQLRRNNEEYRRIRKEKIAELLQATTVVLTEKDFEKETEHGGAQVDLATDDYLGDLDDSTTRVKLPVDAANGNRSVSGLCAICLCPYSTGEKITWSPEISCQHAFHKECIIQWLAKKEELKCPVCRQDYCQPIHVDESFPGSEDLFLDSFALALNYARSHASRSWAGEVSRGSGAGSFAFGFDPPVRVHVMGGNNDLSLRDHSEGVSQDIEMGPTVSSERSSAPPPLITESNAGGGEAVDLSTTVDIVDDREQHLETAIENSNGGEPAMEDAVISNMVEGITIAQHQETSADASLDGEEGMENVAVTDAGDTNGVAEQLSRKDS